MAKNGKKVFSFFKEVKSELKKVVWPSFKQVKNNTLVVIACVLIIGVFIWLLDLGLTKVWTIVNPTETVEQTTENTTTDTKAEGQQMSAEDMKALFQAIGVNYDEATGKCTDVETGAELTEEEVNSRLSALSAENTETPVEGEATAEDETNTEAPAEKPAE